MVIINFNIDLYSLVIKPFIINFLAIPSRINCLIVFESKIKDFFNYQLSCLNSLLFLSNFLLPLISFEEMNHELK